MKDRFAVKVTDSDMMPRFLNGDIAVIDPNIPLQDGDCGLFKLGEGVKLLRWFNEADTEYILHAPSNEISDLPIPKGYAGFEVLGKVVDVAPNLENLGIKTATMKPAAAETE